jgi:hypothetical protein
MSKPKASDDQKAPSLALPRMTLPPEVIVRLRRRGAASRKGRQPSDHGTQSYTLSLQRSLGQFDSIAVHSDPRETRGLAPAVYELIVTVLTSPRTLDLGHIRRLGSYLTDSPLFHERARALGLSPTVLADEINAYSFAEKVHLIDAAELVHHGLAAPAAPRPRANLRGPRPPQPRRGRSRPKQKP